MEVQIDRIRRDLETLNSYNATPGKGVTRLTFSEEYERARTYLIQELRKIGARVTICRAGNLRGRLEGVDEGKPAVMIGSHIDTVLHGGKFDGSVGVVSALEAARVVVEKNIVHRHPIDVVVFAEEEGSRFGSVLTGSRAWAGKLDLKDLRGLKDKDGLSYPDAMERAGVVPEDDSILMGEKIKAMLELHIEQSVVLENKRLQIGIVEAIAGIKQFLVTLQGVANHAGGTPMSLRFDALQGGARIISAVEEIATTQAGKNTVATVGFINCEPGQANVIPGQVQMTLDIRDTESRILHATSEKILEVANKICQDRGLTSEVEERSDTPPIVLSQKILRLIEKLAEKRKTGFLRMFSGALHDSSILAEITDVGMIFVPSKGGRSHCPEESTDLGDITVGADILVESLIEVSA
jgi:allantoate deiminase